MRDDPRRRRPEYDPRLSEQETAAIAEVLRAFTTPILSMRVLGTDEVEVRAIHQGQDVRLRLQDPRPAGRRSMGRHVQAALEVLRS